MNTSLEKLIEKYRKEYVEVYKDFLPQHFLSAENKWFENCIKEAHAAGKEEGYEGALKIVELYKVKKEPLCEQNALLLLISRKIISKLEELRKE